MQKMMWTYAGVFFSAMLLGLAATQGMVWFARRVKLFAPRNTRTVHTLPTPRIGGVAIFISLTLVTVGMLIFGAYANDVFRELREKLMVLFVCGGFIFLVGLVDDIRGMHPSVKLLAQLLAALTVCYFGIRIGKIDQFGWWFGWMSWPITIIWIVGITNAVNLIDGLDGLSAGICATTCVVIGVFSAYTGQVSMGILMTILFGSLIGFLFFNFNPAKIFLGDSGSMFLGFFLATASVICATKVATVIGLLLPALALGLPLFDMLLTIVRRVLERRSIFSPDRGHIHHRLLEMGLNHRNTVIIMYLITLTIVGFGALMMLLRARGELIILVVTILVLLAVFRIAGVLQFRKMFLQVQSNLARMREFRNDRKNFEIVQNRIRRAWTFKQWWLAVRRMARRMGFEQIIIRFRDPECNEIRTLSYRRPTVDGASEDTVYMSVPVRSQHTKALIHVEIEVPVQDSLEAMGRRISLFGRLLDEHTLDAVFDERDKMSEKKQTISV